MEKFFTNKNDESIICRVLTEDEKCKTAIIEFVSGDKKGTTQNVSLATLKRWWRKADLETREIVVEPEVIENLDGTITEVEKEPIEAVVIKEHRKKRAMSETNPELDHSQYQEQFTSQIRSLGYTVKPQKAKNPRDLVVKKDTSSTIVCFKYHKIVIYTRKHFETDRTIEGATSVVVTPDGRTKIEINYDDKCVYNAIMVVKR